MVPLGGPELDLADPQTIETSLHEASPDLIISAAAYPAVDQAETDVADAFAINTAAMAVIGRCAARLGIPVVHLSTDVVFDGEKETPYGERDPVNPLGVYVFRVSMKLGGPGAAVHPIPTSSYQTLASALKITSELPLSNSSAIACNGTMDEA